MTDDDAILAERNRLLDGWERAAPGWGRQADRTHETSLAVSEWLVGHADPQPGERVLELACGPGDTGFIAARKIAPDGVLISSDGAEGMVEVARERAREQGVENVEFKQLQLEWIDLPTADVDVILCRWGVMLTVDPAAALQECRRVLKPGGRLAMAVWDLPERNPWTSIVMRALINLGLVEPPKPGSPGMFAMSPPGLLQEMLEAAGFVETQVDAVSIVHGYRSVQDWLGSTLDRSEIVSAVWKTLDDAQRRAVVAEITELAQPYTDASGALELPGSTLVALASA